MVLPASENMKGLVKSEFAPFQIYESGFFELPFWIVAMLQLNSALLNR